MNEAWVSQDLKLILFGGKGGSGKTTCAAATALYLGRLHPRKKILVMSTDPAHSLGDSFAVTIGNAITPLTRNVWGLELDAAHLFHEFLQRHGPVIREMVERGTLLDRQEVEEVVGLAFLGMDEVMAILRTADLFKAGEYDVIILDTAPTGHTRALLALPEAMERWLHAMDTLMEKHRALVRALTGRYARGGCDHFLESQRKDLAAVGRLLGDSSRTCFIPVTIPEPLSINEVERLAQALPRLNVPARSIIVNRVAESDTCPICLARKGLSDRWVREIQERFSSFHLVKVALFASEIRGLEGLAEFGEVLFGRKRYSPPSRARELREPLPMGSGDLSDLSRQNLRCIICGGKGGVGKTTIAAACALYLARHEPEKKVLLFSTGQAQALSDVLGETIGNAIARMSEPNNLYALEAVGTRLVQDLASRYREGVEEAFASLVASAGADAPFDRRAMEELLELQPPGLDELLALIKVVELLEAGEYDLVVLDSAASGHFVRLLEAPHVVRDWLRTGFHLLQKHRGAVGLDKAFAAIRDVSRGIRKLLEVLTDQGRTDFVMVTIPEAMAVAETRDLAAAIARLNLPSSHTCINMVIPRSGCAFCAARASQQQKYVHQIATTFPHAAIIPIPFLPYDVRGRENLGKLAGILFGEEGSEHPVERAAERRASKEGELWLYDRSGTVRAR